MDKNKKGTEKRRYGLPSRNKPLPSLTSQKEETNGHMSGAALDTFHNPSFLLPQTATTMVLSALSPGQRPDYVVARELTTSLGSGQLGQVPGSSHPVDPRALDSDEVPGRPTALAQGFCAEA